MNRLSTYRVHEKLWGEPARTVENIQAEILETLNLPSTVGMGPNMLMSKLALDLEAKKTGFAKWAYEDVQTKLWPVSPLSGNVGNWPSDRKTLNDMGIYSVGDLAKTELSTIRKEFRSYGKPTLSPCVGNRPFRNGCASPEGQVSYGKSQILMRDYNTVDEIKAVLLEMCEDVARRTREASKVGRTLSLGIGYSKNAFGGGFQRSRTIYEATNDTMKIYGVCKELLNEFHDGRPVRQISVSITKLDEEHSMQLSLFDEGKWRNRQLGATMDSLRNKYGSTAILRAVSLTNAGTAIKRSRLVGGHKG